MRHQRLPSACRARPGGARAGCGRCWGSWQT
jgi:hypothetical protein